MTDAIRAATADDRAAIAAMLMPVIREGATYALDRDMSEAAALDMWLNPDRETLVAIGADGPLGTYYLRANQSGGGAHVANCGYVTAPASRRRGVARVMALHSFEIARARRFRAMQFNFVVESNARAIALWSSLGFRTVGRLPGAFAHPALDHADALVLFRTL